MGVLTLIYLLVNGALLRGLGVEALGQSKTAASDLLGQAFGPWAQKALGLFVAIAALTSINATMIVGARTNFALGRDWPALRFMGHWQVSRGSPIPAYLVQSLISLALVGLGTMYSDGFGVMVEFTAPVFWFFLMLVGISLFIMRRKDPDADRRFSVPLYPLTPIVFCLTCAYLTYSRVTYAASRGAVHISLLVTAVGVVALIATGRVKRVQHQT